MARTRARGTSRKSSGSMVDVDLESFNGDSETELAGEPGAFDALFEGYNAENVRVTLRRLEPEHWADPETGELIRVKGYLESLPPSLPDYEAYIRAKYGGGRYLASKVEDGRYKLNRYIDVGGPPNVRGTVGPAPAGTPAGRTDKGTLVGGGQVDGISIDGDDAAFMRRLERVAQIKVLLGGTEPQDINGVILQHILKQHSPDPFTQFQTFAKLLDSARDIVGNGGGSSDGWLGVADKALGMVSRLPALRGNAAPLSTTPTEKEPETMTPDPRELANQALGIIVGSFRRKNRPEPARVANALSSMFPVPQADRRAAFAPHYDWLDVNGGAALSDDFLDNPELEDQWPDYLKAVFDAYCGAAT